MKNFKSNLIERSVLFTSRDLFSLSNVRINNDKNSSKLIELKISTKNKPADYIIYTDLLNNKKP